MASECVSAFERACERETQRRLDDAEAQLYGERPIVPTAQPLRPWDPPTGAGDSIAEWQARFVCLRVVGTAIVAGDAPGDAPGDVAGNAAGAEHDGQSVSSSEADDWAGRGGAEPAPEEAAPDDDDDADLWPDDEAQPFDEGLGLSGDAALLAVSGFAAPRTARAEAADPEEEVFCSDGELMDYLAFGSASTCPEPQPALLNRDFEYLFQETTEGPGDADRAPPPATKQPLGPAGARFLLSGGGFSDVGIVKF
ncbi:hypothetical protein M885DRAFT_518781 [Pelagophyceae sp. CCMP2097]|nr:hypothetical protein M885DRAFT_518781 [Pelagophyceae sp. CCMP2097]